MLQPDEMKTGFQKTDCVAAFEKCPRCNKWTSLDCEVCMERRRHSLGRRGPLAYCKKEDRRKINETPDYSEVKEMNDKTPRDTDLQLKDIMCKRSESRLHL
jgi:hypothetical protein